MAFVSVSALVANLTPAYRNHRHLLMVLALTLALFSDERTEQWVLRCQLSILYGFAAVAKLNADWLSGLTLEAMTWPGELLPAGPLVAMAVVTVIVEIVLAIGVRSPRPGFFWLAVLTHGAFLLFTQSDGWDITRLAVFGAISVATWLRASPRASAAGVLAAGLVARARPVDQEVDGAETNIRSP